jgi:uncharacterized protein DUF1579
MKLCIAATSVAALAATFVLSAYAWQAGGQDSKPKNATAPMHPEPKPGPEHALLAKMAGSWEATVKEASMDPKTPPTTSKGTEVDRMVGGLWLVSDFNSEMGGKSFSGHGVLGYDTDKKKYVSVWVDTMSTSAAMGEGSYDAATNKLTMMSKTKMEGQEVTMREVTEFKDADNLLFHLYMPGADGKEMEFLTIEYKRKK